MIIDAHGHLVPPTLLDTISQRSADFPSVQMQDHGGRPGFSFSGSKATRPVSPGLTDLSKRLDWMDEQGIDRQVVGGWLDMMGNQLPVGEGAAWARMINAHMIDAATAEPRFIPMAALPMQDGELAADVLREADGGGMRSAMIGTQPKGTGGVLDDPALDPFWQAADDLGTVLHIHPVFESGDDRVHDYGMTNAVGRVTDSLIAVSRLIYSGHVARFSNVKIVVGIGGAALPFVVGRLRRNFALHPELGDPDDALRRMYYDTVVHDPATLRFLIDTVGADRVMMGSDMPFPIGDPAPIDVINAAGLSPSDREAVLGGVAAGLFA